MAKKIKGYIKLEIPAGQANPSPPVGPALGQQGLNIMEFCKQFNARTQEKQGELLPVLITIYQDKTFDFIIKTPPVSASIMKKAGIKKGSPEPNRKKVGAMTWEEVQEIAALKMPDLNTLKPHAAIKMIAGTAQSMGVSIQGETPWNS